MARKRITSDELTDIRAVLNHTRAARERISDVSHDHTDHELSMMRSALGTAIYVLEQAEQLVGYRDDDAGGSGGNDTGGNSPDSPVPPKPGLQGPVLGTGRKSGPADRPAATSGLYGGI